jgi:adenine deaminase
MTRFLLVGLVAASLIASCFAQSSADRVFRNGKIYTMDARGTIAQAIAIRDGRIVYVGTNDKLAPSSAHPRKSPISTAASSCPD